MKVYPLFSCPDCLSILAYSIFFQLVSNEEDQDTSADQHSSKPPDAEACDSHSGGSSQVIATPSTEEEKPAEPLGNSVPSTVDSPAETPVKENARSELKDRERAGSSPKTLRELSKEASKMADDHIMGSSDNVQVDEGIDMKGTD